MEANQNQGYMPQPQYAPPPYYPYYPPAQKDNSTKLIVTGTLGLLGIGLVGYGIYTYSGLQEQKKQQQIEDKVASGDNDAQIVNMLYKLIYPTSLHGKYGRKTTGEDAAALLNIASQINDFAYVKKNYSIVQGSNGRVLLDDLKEQLDSHNYTEFIRRANERKNNGTANQPKVDENGQEVKDKTVYVNTGNAAPKTEQNGVFRSDWIGKIAIMNQSANVRTEPKVGNNIYIPMSDIKKDYMIGLFTGKVTNDGWAEIYVKFDTDKIGVNQYAHRNAVKEKSFFNVFGRDFKKEVKETGILVYVKKDYVYAPSKKSGKGSQYGYSSDSTIVNLKGCVATVRKTIVYDEKMRGLGMVNANIKLGELAYTLHDRDNKEVVMYGFDSPNGLRWVRSQDTFTL